MNADKLVIDFGKVFQVCMEIYSDGKDALDQYKSLHEIISKLNKNGLLIEELVERKNQLDNVELVVNPNIALNNPKSITCCICGKEFCKLTEDHMTLSHGITLADYRDLCGYDEDTNLSR